VDTPNGKLTHKLNEPLLRNWFAEKKKLLDLEKVQIVKDDELTKANNKLNELFATPTGEDEKINATEAVKNAITAVKDTKSLKAATKTEIGNLMGKELLGEFKYYYEFSDLFRDDKNPSNMDLMKFQMFGWTIVAIVVYSFLFLNDLRQNIDSLPLVPESIVILTGLSQAGYLAGKGVSNIPANEKKNA
jgi:hypothetical protein